MLLGAGSPRRETRSVAVHGIVLSPAITQGNTKESFLVSGPSTETRPHLTHACPKNYQATVNIFCLQASTVSV